MEMYNVQLTLNQSFFFFRRLPKNAHVIRVNKKNNKLILVVLLYSVVDVTLEIIKSEGIFSQITFCYRASFSN